jgi:hypothetical protein
MPMRTGDKRDFLEWGYGIVGCLHARGEVSGAYLMAGLWMFGLRVGEMRGERVLQAVKLGYFERNSKGDMGSWVV